MTYASRTTLILTGLGAWLTAAPAAGIVLDPDLAATPPSNIEHCDATVDEGDFFETFECGDELFETRFNANAGVGMDVGDGGRFTRVPRADMPNWASTTPRRETGPNAEACNVCHTTETIGGAGDGAGPAGLNVIRDPQGAAHPGSFIQRNTPHLFGMGGPQLAAEEMSTELESIVDATVASCGRFGFRFGDLTTKGVDFGTVVVRCSNKRVTVLADGIDDDLVVKPFQWKGNEISVRSFSRGAFHNELGMTPQELAGDDVDGDFDGVANEVSVADVTAMAIYLAAQPRPTSLIELDDLRTTLESGYGAAGAAKAEELGLPALSVAERQAISNGEQVFAAAGCASCHRPTLTVNNPVFAEPSLHPAYRDSVFPGGQPGIDPAEAITFDITVDPPDNVIDVDGTVVALLGAFETDPQGRAIVRLYGDLKRHDMGPGLAENIDETGAGSSVWMTKELWGVGNTAPYLHDGRAPSLEEAILEHGGDAADERNAYAALDPGSRADLVAFLNNLVLFFPSEEEEE